MHRLMAISALSLLMAGCSAPSSYYTTPYQPTAIPPAQTATTSTYPGWEDIGDWHVKAISDSMSTITHVKLFTKFNYEGVYYPGMQGMTFGIEIFGDKIATISPGSGFTGRGVWPYCDFNESAVSVDGSKAISLMPIRSPGSCNNIEMEGEAIQKLLAGNNAKLRIGGMDGTVSLVGFKAAWAKARDLAK